MKITFVALGSEQLAISQLSAIAKREGHDVSLAFSASLFNDRFNLEIPWLGDFFDDTYEVLRVIEQEQPDVLAFSCLTATYRWSLGVAESAKKMLPNVKTIFGGVHISAVPDRVIHRPEVDYIVVGEGDLAFPEILRSIARGGASEPIDNTRFKDEYGNIIRGLQKGFIQDLDSLPPYDKVIWEEYIRIGDLYLTMASRGCPYTCSFCFNNFFVNLPEEASGKYVRQRSVDHMMHELLQAKKRYKLRYVDFQDDIFTVRKPWLKEFLHRYKKEINVPFQCLTHPRYMDDEVAKWLYEAGCTWVQMGVQTMDDDFKKDIRRYENSDHIVKALEAMNRNGLIPKVDHMFGLPGEPIEAQEMARQVYAEQSPKRIQTFWTSFLPGTDIMKQGLELGIVSPEEAERVEEGIDFYFFRYIDNIKDPDLVKMYQAYEVLFKAFPILPNAIRKRIRPEHVKWIPMIISRNISGIVDLITGFRHGNPDFVWYAQHYILQLRRSIARKFGFKPPRGTKPKVEIITRSELASEREVSPKKSVA